MRQQSCSALRFPLGALAFILAFCATPARSGEIFKCVAKDGTALYQNFPCNIESLGFLPLDAAKAKPAPAVAPPTPAKPNAAVVSAPVPPSVNVASTAKPADQDALRVGMSSDEVRALWGEPEDVIEDEPAIGGPVSLWRYAGGRSVQFDHKHLVMGVQR